MDRKLYYIDKNRIKEKNNNENDNSNINTKNENNQIIDSNIENVLDKMKSNINNLKLHKPIKEKTSQNNINIKNNIINKNDNIIINSINIENNIINNNQKILYINNKNDLSQKQIENIIIENKTEENNNQENESIKKEKSSNNTIKNNEINADENLNINQSIKVHQDKTNNLNKNSNINILQNLKGISSSQNKGYESTLMSNVSYSSFLSFKNKKVKFVNLNTSINQSLLNNKSKQDEIKKLEEEDNEKINKIEQENMMKNILKRFGGSTDIIKEKEDEQEDKNIKINIEENKNKNLNINNKIKENEESESLLFNISKQYQIKASIKNIEENNKNKSNNSTNNEKEKKVIINNIKCTLSFLDKGKAIFVSENDDIFWLPSATLNEKIKVGNSYLFQIDKLNNQIKKMNEIENIQNKYRVWK